MLFLRHSSACILNPREGITVTVETIKKSFENALDHVLDVRTWTNTTSTRPYTARRGHWPKHTHHNHRQTPWARLHCSLSTLGHPPRGCDVHSRVIETFWWSACHSSLVLQASAAPLCHGQPLLYSGQAARLRRLLSFARSLERNGCCS